MFFRRSNPEALRHRLEALDALDQSAAPPVTDTREVCRAVLELLNEGVKVPADVAFAANGSAISPEFLELELGLVAKSDSDRILLDPGRRCVAYYSLGSTACPRFGTLCPNSAKLQPKPASTAS